MLNIYLTNLGKYNEGYLIGEWVSLPVTASELAAVKERIGISEEPDEQGRYYEEWFITDYETDVEGVTVGEYENLETLNEFAETLEGLDDGDKKAIQAMLLDGYSFNEAIEKVTNGEYTIYCGCDSMADVAMEIVEETGMFRNVPDTITRYFDYEAYGRDLDIEGTFYNIDGDMVEIHK